MVTPAPMPEPRGIRLEPDGSIVLEREPTVPGERPEIESLRADHVRYPVANPTLSAVLENPGRIGAYQAFNVGPVLEPGAWRLELAVDGRPLGSYPPHTRVRGRLMAETWEGRGCRLSVSSFCDGERNAIYQAYEMESLDGDVHALEASVRAAFLADEERGAYGLHFDERYDAITAILGEVVPEVAAQAEGKGSASPVPARAALIGADRPPDDWRVSDQRAYLTYRLETPPHGQGAFCLVVTGGWSRAEHEALFQQASDSWRQALSQARQHGDWLARRLELDSPALHSMFAAGLNAALSAYRQDHQGRFRGLVPAPDSGFEPGVTIPADAYWCAQAVLPFQPERVRDEILALARAVHEDGKLARTVRTVPRAALEVEPGAGPYDEWPDACDSPSYFALLVRDYLCWTEDRSILDTRQDGHTVWQKVLACVDYLRRRDTNRDYLFEKVPAQPDWAFDIRRDDWVTYDLALHVQALKGAAEIALLLGDKETARDLVDWADGAHRAINRRLWDEGRGHYVDYIRSYQGFVEDHAAIDTAVAALYNIGTESQCHRHLEHLERTLETRHNDQQYYGDWGVMSCFPFYKQRSDLTGRSAWAYSFHNGAAWPGWCGVYALAELLHRRPGWRYALERWWTYGLEQYWLAPTEHYSPPYAAPAFRRSADLSAWSSMPAAAMILGGFGFWPSMAGELVLRAPPWGDSRLNGVHFRGGVYDVVARGEVVSILQDGDVVASGSHGLRIRLGREPAVMRTA